jgi:hypothetical protein
MRAIRQSMNRERLGERAATHSKVTDETAYLLSSKFNAERLLKSIDNLRAGKLMTLNPVGATEGGTYR